IGRASRVGRDPVLGSRFSSTTPTRIIIVGNISELITLRVPNVCSPAFRTLSGKRSLRHLCDLGGSAVILFGQKLTAEAQSSQRLRREDIFRQTLSRGSSYRCEL